MKTPLLPTQTVAEQQSAASSRLLSQDGVADARPQAAQLSGIKAMMQSSPRTLQLQSTQEIARAASVTQAIPPARGDTLSPSSAPAPLQQKPAFQFKNDQPVQLRATKIVHQSADYGADFAKDFDDRKVGLSMRAELMPEDPIKGSEPAKVNTPMYGALWKSNSIVRGHLLNHDLGGIGMPSNLFPITSGANSRHSKLVEANVKNELYAAHAYNKKKNHEDHWVQYDVDVINNSNLASGFACTWSRKDKQGKDLPGFPKKEPIVSEFVRGEKKDPWSGSGTGLKISTWAHGKGSRFKGDEVKLAPSQVSIKKFEATAAAVAHGAAAAVPSGSAPAKKADAKTDAPSGAMLPASGAAVAAASVDTTAGDTTEAIQKTKALQKLQDTLCAEWMTKNDVATHLATLPGEAVEEFDEYLATSIEDAVQEWLHSADKTDLRIKDVKPEISDIIKKALNDGEKKLTELLQSNQQQVAQPAPSAAAD